MRIHGWSLLAITIWVLGVQQGRAQEIVGTTGNTEATHIAPAAAEPCVVSDMSQPTCCERLWNWLTYRPLSRPGCCGCCKPCEPCGMPPLYIFFLCDRYGHCGCTGPAATVAPAGGQAPANGQSQTAGH
jgi:hypothetical protein